jgi:Na+-driven multidrug efflux pump
MQRPRSLAQAYLLWFLPGLLLQFPLVALGSALRATGIIKPAVGFQVLSVFLNILLTPLLIFGIGPWPKLGVTGAAFATFISILIADVLMLVYFEKKCHYVSFRFPPFRPQTQIWRGMLRIGVPAGAEFLLLYGNDCDSANRKISFLRARPHRRSCAFNYPNVFLESVRV